MTIVNDASYSVDLLATLVYRVRQLADLVLGPLIARLQALILHLLICQTGAQGADE